MKNKIILITTEGCEACNIMSNLIKRALLYDMMQAKSIEYIEMDFKDFKKSQFKAEQITDFPTMLFVNGNEIVNTYTGTNTIGFIISESMKCFGANNN